MTGGERVSEWRTSREEEPGGSARARGGSADQVGASPAASPVRVLAHIHTFNDAGIIDATIESLLRQTRPVDQTLIVASASPTAPSTAPL